MHFQSSSVLQLMYRFLIFLFLLSESLAAQQTDTIPPLVIFSITGIVTDSETGETLPAVVIVAEAAGTAKTAVVTDLEGNYEFRLQHPGNYLLQFHMTGYNSEALPVQLTKEKQVTINVKLCRVNQHTEVTIYTQCRIPHPPVPIVRNSPQIIVPVMRKPDTLVITNIRHSTGDSASTWLLHTGKLYRSGDSIYYFNTGSCPKNIVYRYNGKKLVRDGIADIGPEQFVFRKTRKGWKIKGPGGTRARVNALK